MTPTASILTSKQKIDYKKQGTINRRKGMYHETRVRADLEKDGWIVDKWSNNVELPYECFDNNDKPIRTDGKLIPAKRKFNPFNKILAIGTGFPDFIAFKYTPCAMCTVHNIKTITGDIIAIEAKSNGKLSKKEKQKCQWLLDHNIFRKIYISNKGTKRGEIIYTEFNNKKEVQTK